MPIPSGRFHWPEKSGYLLKSTTWAWAVEVAVDVTDIATTAVAVTIRARTSMLSPPIELHRKQGARFCRRFPHFRADAEGGESSFGGAVGADHPGVALPLVENIGIMVFVS